MNFTIETYVLLLLIAGTLCILFGLLLHFKNDKAGIKYSKLVSEPPPNHTYTSQNFTISQDKEVHDEIKTSKISANIDLTKKTNQFDQADNKINVKLSKDNIKFIKKNVYLYFDHDPNNIYTGEEKTSEITEIDHIKRVGQGTLSYDGVSFRFAHENRVQIFNIDELDYVALYPNCFVIISQKEIPAALFFMDETESTRKFLNVFKC